MKNFVAKFLSCQSFNCLIISPAFMFRKADRTLELSVAYFISSSVASSLQNLVSRTGISLFV